MVTAPLVTADTLYERLSDELARGQYDKVISLAEKLYGLAQGDLLYTKEKLTDLQRLLADPELLDDARIALTQSANFLEVEVSTYRANMESYRALARTLR